VPDSREKGKRGEREFANELRKLGINARRSQQFCGTDGTADVKTDIEGVHVEVKRRGKIAAIRFLEQAERDKNDGDFPIVAMREDRGPWTVMLRLNNLQELVKAFAGRLTLPITSDSYGILRQNGSNTESSQDTNGTKS
tara:strand:+ start:374 stop:790 length:417 start_codon:yes stop_codon:yes gene_type:complete